MNFHIIAVSCLFSGVLLALSIWRDYRSRRDLLNVKNLVVLHVALINSFQPIVSLLLSDFRFVDLVNESRVGTVVYAGFITLLGTLALVIGLHRPGSSCAQPPVPTARSVSLAAAPLGAFIAVLYCAGCLSSLYLLTNTTVEGAGYAERVSDFRFGAASFQGVTFSSKLIYTMGTLGFFYILVMLLVLHRTIKLSGGRNRWWLLLVAATCPLFTLVSGFRGPFLLGAIVLIIYVNKCVWKLRNAITLFCLAVLVCGVAIFGPLRENIERKSSVLGSINVFDAINAQVINRTRGVETLVATIEANEAGVVERRYFGDSIYELVTLPVPRNLVDWKPTPVSFRFGAEVFGAYLFQRDGVVSEATNGLSAPLFAFAFWEAGLPGVVLLPFLFGLLLRKYDQLFYKNTGSCIALGVSLAIVPALLAAPEHPQVAVNTAEIALLAVGLPLLAFRYWPR